MFLLKILNPKYIKWYLKSRKLRIQKNVVLKNNVKLDNSTSFEGMNLIQNGVTLINSKIGLGTYISGNSKFVDAFIGRFCSIGQEVGNGFALHPSKEFVSTHPAFFSIGKQAGFTFVSENKFKEHKYINGTKKLRLIVGNDVWIGHKVLLMDGIKIGDGAIVGAGAVVTKDVEPYSIVGGVPAKLIRKRFNDEQIKYLLNLKWWDKDLDWINSKVYLFSSIAELMKRVKV